MVKVTERSMGGGKRKRCGCGHHPVTQCVGRGQDGAHSISPFLSPGRCVYPSLLGGCRL